MKQPTQVSEFFIINKNQEQQVSEFVHHQHQYLRKKRQKIPENACNHHHSVLRPATKNAPPPHPFLSLHFPEKSPKVWSSQTITTYQACKHPKVKRLNCKVTWRIKQTMKLLKHKDDETYHSLITLDHREEDREWGGAPVAWEEKIRSVLEKDEEASGRTAPL